MMNLLLFVALSHMATPPHPGVGDLAPHFQAVDTQGHKVQLKELTDKGPLVLVFFPKAGTSICTQELATFVAKAPQFAAKGAQIVAVSADNTETLARFRQQLGASFTFVPDPQGQLLKLYDVKMPLVTKAKRRTYLIDSLGRIAFVAEGEDAAGLKGLLEALGRL